MVYPDSDDLYASVYRNHITDILPVRPKDNVVISYQNKFKMEDKMLLFNATFFSFYCCNNENVFWVTLGDYNGNGMFLTIHPLNIAGVFYCFPT